VRVFCIGDVFGKPGRLALKGLLPGLKKERQIHFVTANAENAAAGFGLTPDVAEEMFDAGVDVLTSGNHIWDKQEVHQIIDSEPRLLRPANYPAGVPGRGWGIYEAQGKKVGVLNLIGRVYIKEFDNPFPVGLAEIEKISQQTRIILVDLHAEVTSEKIAMGWYFDGKISLLFGTHTHIQTADERVLPQGTAYISDLGMTGPYDSVIGVKKEIIIERFLTQLPHRFEVATGDVKLCGVVVDIDDASGKAVSIERVQLPFPKQV